MLPTHRVEEGRIGARRVGPEESSMTSTDPPPLIVWSPLEFEGRDREATRPVPSLSQEDPLGICTRHDQAILQLTVCMTKEYQFDTTHLSDEPGDPVPRTQPRRRGIIPRPLAPPRGAAGDRIRTPP